MSEQVIHQTLEQQCARAETEIAKEYLVALLQILNLRGHGELNFSKQSITTPNGGTYMLQFVHVDGPKINCQNLKELE